MFKFSLSLFASVFLLAVSASPQTAAPSNARPRARELGIRPGTFEPGALNAITDVPGVRVGHTTIISGDGIRTGVTAIVPHSGNLFREKVAAAVHVFNAFGKLVGSTQVEELGQLETPVVLTNTLSVWDAAAATASWMLARPGNENVRSINPVVGETNDGYLNDIRGRHVKAEYVIHALESATNGPVEEGSVGAGTGTMALGWKGGIGTSSRRVTIANGNYTIGVLVQTNFGGNLTMDGIPVWKDLRPTQIASVGSRHSVPAELPSSEFGSCMIIVATDAPLDARQLRRLAARAIHGLARAGSNASHGSGDFVIAFSTTNRYILPDDRLRSNQSAPATNATAILREDDISPLFAAVIEATEEAIYNSLLRATTIHGRDGHSSEAIPIDRLRALLQKRVN
ncbi:MAG: P1 family peptidase [Acidobacteria bacterium]|nr:P1 family peptidase [Acidobacteriota bacterium]